ncbi:MAG: diguanylate cyclase [Pseudomonadota bacterium]
MRNYFFHGLGRPLGAAFIPLLVFPAFAAASGVLELSPTQDKFLLTPHMEILRNADPAWKIEDLAYGKFDSQFLAVEGEKVELGYSNNVNWLRFRLREKSSDRLSDLETPGRDGWVLTSDYAFFFELALYGPFYPGRSASGEAFRPLGQVGLDLPFGEREFQFRLPAVPLPRTPGTESVYYLRTVSRSFFKIEFGVETVARFFNLAHLDSIVFGLCYGVLSCMLMYNLFICVSLKSRVYLVYTLYIFSLLAASLFLYGHIARLIDIPGTAYLRLMWFFAGAFTFWALAFMRTFLNTGFHAPRLDKVLLGAMGYGAAMALFGLLGWTRLAWGLGLFSSFVSPSLGLIVGLVGLRLGIRTAFYFMLAWGVLAVSTLILSLDFLGLAPDLLLVKRILPVGSALESILLSLALADRIKSLRREKEALKSSETRFRRLSLMDGLTGLSNKRRFEEYLAVQVSRAGREGASLGLLMMDLDDFKTVNDSHGHQAGDLVLAGLAGILRGRLRENDEPCRLGGEEFAAILPGLEIKQAREVAERIRASVARREFEFGGRGFRVTLSLGLAMWRPGESPFELVKRADRALYEAKAAGKNRVAAAE